MELLFTKEESIKAHHDWKANCGPHAIAAACHITLRQVEAKVAPFPGWMGPTQLEKALKRLQCHFIKHGHLYTKEAKPGILRIQWRGPWKATEAYKHTHWVACSHGHIHDTRREDWLGKWTPFQEWKTKTEAFAAKNYKGWHFTHWYQLLRLPQG